MSNQIQQTAAAAAVVVVLQRTMFLLPVCLYGCMWTYDCTRVYRSTKFKHDPTSFLEPANQLSTLEIPTFSHISIAFSVIVFPFNGLFSILMRFGRRLSQNDSLANTSTSTQLATNICVERATESTRIGIENLMNHYSYSNKYDQNNLVLNVSGFLHSLSLFHCLRIITRDK